MRTILLILDGLGDRGHAIFGGKTPLQAARTPNLDRIATAGINGLYHSYGPGAAMSSELAHFLMFGYDLGDFPGRGILEATGLGIDVKENDAALLARIVSVRPREGMLILADEAPSAEEEACRVLVEQIRTFEKDGVCVEFVPTGGIEGILILRGEVSEKITDSNPIFSGRPLMEVCPSHNLGVNLEAAETTAGVLNAYLTWCYRQLSAHPLNRERERKGLPPINALGTQRAGKMRQLEPFAEKWGFKGLSIASGSVYHGLFTSLGMDIVRAGESGDAERDLITRLALAKDAVDFDFIHVHTKTPDVAAHGKNPVEKRDVIESLDRAISFAVEHFISDEEILLVVTSDHATPSAGNMIHSGEALPVTMHGIYTQQDEVRTFDEVSCARGGLGFLRGAELMHLILNYTDRGKLWGLMDTPVNQPYSPGRYKALKVD